MGERESMNPENAVFWLPSHFLTDDDFISDHKKEIHAHTHKSFDLFSNGFDPFNPLESPEIDRNNHDDELLAELTRQLAHSSLHDPTYHTEKKWSLSTSPQSTLSGFGPSQGPSPPLTPPGVKNDAAWELLYEAATQVARLKMNAMAAAAAQLNNQQHQQNRGGTRGTSLYTYLNQQVKREGRGEFYLQHDDIPRRSCGGGNGGGQSAWGAVRAGHGHQPQYSLRQSEMRGGGSRRGGFYGGPGLGLGPRPGLEVKRQSTGTGVFIPRRFGTHSEYRKKPTGCPNVTLPAGVVQALNLNVEPMNSCTNLSSSSRLSSGFVTNNDIMLARRNAVLSQQRRNIRPEMAVGHDVGLPSDWTY